MLITLNHQWGRPPWGGIKVLALRSDTHMPANGDKSLDDEWRLFHLTQPMSDLAIVQTVLDRLDRHRQFQPDPLIFAPCAWDDAACTAEAGRLTADPWRLQLATVADSHAIERLVIGPSYTGHSIFLRFFRSLRKVDGKAPSDVIAQLHHDLGSGQ